MRSRLDLFLVVVGLPWRSFKRNRTWCTRTSALFSGSRSLLASTKLAHTAVTSREGEDFIMSMQSGELATLPLRNKDSSAIPAACWCVPASCRDCQQNWAGSGLESLALSLSWGVLQVVCMQGCIPGKLWAI